MSAANRIPGDKFVHMLSKNQTLVEKTLWGLLRLQPLQFEFYSQQIIRGWIADFYCPELKLVIEVDGPPHESEKRKRRDFVREQAMAEDGITTFRFSNREVLEDLEWVYEEIRNFAEAYRRIHGFGRRPSGKRSYARLS